VLQQQLVDDLLAHKFFGVVPFAFPCVMGSGPGHGTLRRCRHRVAAPQLAAELIINARHVLEMHHDRLHAVGCRFDKKADRGLHNNLRHGNVQAAACLNELGATFVANFQVDVDGDAPLYTPLRSPHPLQVTRRLRPTALSTAFACQRGVTRPGARFSFRFRRFRCVDRDTLLPLLVGDEGHYRRASGSSCVGSHLDIA
jgi:hypothetical protein